MAANINYMMAMVKAYLSGKTPRYIFELDFQTQILARYKKMVKEHREFAELFYDLLSEDGVDRGDELSDAEFKRLIRRQYNEIKSIAADGCVCQEKSDPRARKILIHRCQENSDPFEGKRWENTDPPYGLFVF